MRILNQSGKVKAAIGLWLLVLLFGITIEVKGFQQYNGGPVVGVTLVTPVIPTGTPTLNLTVVTGTPTGSATPTNTPTGTGTATNSPTPPAQNSNTLIRNQVTGLEEPLNDAAPSLTPTVGTGAVDDARNADFWKQYLFGTYTATPNITDTTTYTPTATYSSTPTFTNTPTTGAPVGTSTPNWNVQNTPVGVVIILTALPDLVDTYTFTPTMTSTRTYTPTPVYTQTFTYTPTLTFTPTSILTIGIGTSTFTYTNTPVYTNTFTMTFTNTYTPTFTVSPTPTGTTPTVTLTPTPVTVNLGFEAVTMTGDLVALTNVGGHSVTAVFSRPWNHVSAEVDFNVTSPFQAASTPSMIVRADNGMGQYYQSPINNLGQITFNNPPNSTGANHCGFFLASVISGGGSSSCVNAKNVGFSFTGVTPTTTVGAVAIIAVGTN